MGNYTQIIIFKDFGQNKANHHFWRFSRQLENLGGTVILITPYGGNIKLLGGGWSEATITREGEASDGPPACWPWTGPILGGHTNNHERLFDGHFSARKTSQPRRA